MISLAGRDILHSWSKFVLTGFGLGLLIGVTLSMAGIYRGMVDDAHVLLNNSGADLWVVQKDTLGPYAEPSTVHDDIYRSLLAMPGVAQAANVTYLTMQVRQGETDVRAMVVGFVPGEPGEPRYLIAGRRVTRSHYEAVADVTAGFAVGESMPVPQRLLWASVAALLLLTLSQPAFTSLRRAFQSAQPNTQVLAIRWFRDHVPAQTVVGSEWYTGLFWSATIKLEEVPTLGQSTPDYFRTRGAQFVAASSDMYDRFYAEPARYADFVAAYERFWRELPLVIQFAPDPWRRPGPTIRILRVP